MTIGQERGTIITDLISKTQPKVMAELGGYIGYSAIKFGSAVRNEGGRCYYSFEQNAEWASVASKLIELAELQDFVTIIPGPSSESLLAFGSQRPDQRIDMLFIDHAEALYRKDLGICEQRGLLAPGAYVVADNVSGSCAQDYVAWVMRNKSDVSTKTHNGIYDSYMSSHELPNGETV
ncbi:O-methyltransferase [Aspergillus ruber CBS 135680]|uniref:catechol O-methyltransferase n=1 Tax=Aspergillus ruber (strain CBS 135680) TaxID=1388766 RepID=A0A017SPU3_ASPRC|nr:S-adenosyl-L-methionine-dependent methyltransferase [Aspergillus ruber CBS 135680]EYE98290.1 S-adenosyl-L-methionine-dependent methyltransferase [Aspergillus ruber CBS 135680]